MKKSPDEKIILSAEIRSITGKKTKKLRKQGIIPANIFGTNFKSTAIAANLKEFKKNYKLIKEKPFFYLRLNKEDIPLIIHQIQYHPLTHEILHIDFRKVDLKEKVEVSVPVKVIGVSEAVSAKGGVLLQQKDKLTIESLPSNIPPVIEINIEKLKEIGDEIKVKDLGKTGQYTIKDDPNSIIVSVIAHKEEKIQPEQPPAPSPTPTGETELPKASPPETQPQEK